MKKTIYLYLLLITGTLGSCKKFLEEQVDNRTLITSITDMEKTVNYLLPYSDYHFTDLMTDDYTSGQAGNIQPNRLTLGGLTAFGTVLRDTGRNADTNFLRAIYDAAPSSSPGDAGLIGFIYHEFTHYLDSKHQIPVGFEAPARTEYLRGSDQYKSVPLATAISKGFFIPYGMQNEHEDFATYVQTMIWKNDQQMDTVYLTNNATRTKYKLVTQYFEKLGIPIKSLRDYLNRQSVKDRLILLKRRYE